MPSAFGLVAHSPVANEARSMVYFVTADNRLRKIRGSDGRVIWDTPVGPQALPYSGWNAVLAGGNVIIPRDDVIAFDTTTGAMRWKLPSRDDDAPGYTSIAGDGHSVYAASRLGRVYALDGRTGEARWTLDLNGGNPDNGALNATVADGSVYVCTRTVGSPRAAALWAIDAATGIVRWKHDFTPELPEQGAMCYGHAAVWRDLVIEPQADGRVFAFAQSTGEVRWIAPRVHDISTSLEDMRFPAAGDSILIVTSVANNGKIVAYDPVSGIERWRYGRRGGSGQPPVIVGSTGYVAHGWFYGSYDVRSGAVRWQTPASDWGPESPFVSRPVVAGDRIFVGGRDGSYALVR